LPDLPEKPAFGRYAGLPEKPAKKGGCLKAAIVAVIAVLLPLPAHADPLAPVTEVMDVARQLWSENPPETLDYFEPDRLERLYSASFVAAYKEARKFPAFEPEPGQTEGYPFDYDVIANSQDGCPLEDVKLAKTGEEGGVTTVTATFKLWGCSEDPSERDFLSEVRFKVIEEYGKPVISDIVRMLDGEGLSLLEEMQYIVSGEPQIFEEGEQDGAAEGEENPD
jgi:hypothetical protein